MRIMITCASFKTQLPIRLSFDARSHKGIFFGDGLIANLTDIWHGFQYLRPFEMYDFSNLGNFVHGYTIHPDVAVISSNDIYKVFLFEDLFSGKKKEWFRFHTNSFPNVQYNNGIVYVFLSPMIVFGNFLIQPKQFILFDTHTNQYIHSIIPCYQRTILDVKRHHNGYILLLETGNRNKIEILLTLQGKVVFLGDELNKDLSHDAPPMISIIDYPKNFISPTTDYKIVASAAWAFENMELWNMSLYQSKQLVSEFGICIEKGKIHEIPQYIKGILEGNPIDNYLGTPLNDYFYEFKI